MISRRQAVGELVVAGVLWGFGFIATVWALRAYTTSELVVVRYLLAVLAGEFLWWVLLRRPQDAVRGWKGDFRLAIPAGLLLAAFVFPQTYGLKFTTAAKSGFLTTFYVILVPLFNRVFFGAPIAPARYLHALIAIAGALLLMGAEFGNVNPGDVITLICAALAAAHIIYIDRISKKIVDPFRFNTFQSLFAGLGVAPLLLIQDRVTVWTADPLAIAGLLSLALASSVVAFTIQIRAQKVLPPTTASMLFLLESPFALLFAILLLNESLGPLQASGAFLILLAAFLSVRRHD